LARAALAFAVDVCRPVSKEQAIAALEQAKKAVASLRRQSWNQIRPFLEKLRILRDSASSAA
jgi:hypothetical protein